MASSKRSWQKWILWGLGLGLLLIATFIAMERYGEHYLQQRIPTLADSLGYKLDLKRVDIHLWQGSLQVDSLAASRTPSDPDSTSLVQFNVDVVSISGMRWWQWLWGDTLSVEDIIIDQPTITLTGRTQNFESEEGSFGDKSPSRNLLPLMINRLQVNNASAKLLHPRDSTEEASVTSVQLMVEELVLDPTAESPHSMLQYSALEAEISEFYCQTPKNFYDITLQHAQISSSQSTLILDSLAVTPRYPRYDFAREYGYEIDRVELLIPRLSLNQLDLEALKQGRFHAARLQVQRPRLELFHDKRMPSPQRSHRPLPHKQLQELSFRIHLDTITVEQANITYSEHLQLVAKPGTISFEQLDASIYHVSNDSTRPTPGKPLVLDARTYLMGAAPLHVSATFPADTEADHRVTGSLDALLMQELSAVTEPLGLVRLTSGQINSLEFDMKLNSVEATGTVLLEYRDLKIELLEREKNGNDRNKDLLSFLANTLKVKSDNQKPLREGTISLKRDPQMSIFSYWWKALLSGLKSSIGL